MDDRALDEDRNVINAAGASGLGRRPWQHARQPASDADLVRYAAWCAREPSVDPAVLTAGLRLLGSARAELDQTEAALLFAARAAGLTFQHRAGARARVGTGRAAADEPGAGAARRNGVTRMWTPLRSADFWCGAKAVGLRRLMEGGFDVPDGVVVSDLSLTDWPSVLEYLGPGPYAVRSSASDEDGGGASFAGQFHTSLNLKTATEVADAARRTVASHRSAAVGAYAATLGRGVAGTMSVIVQRMVDAEAAGVAFTRHPITGAEQVVIEATTGLGDKLVAGAIQPERWVVDDDSGDRGSVPRPEQTSAVAHAAKGVLAPDQARAVARIARRVEILFGRPQDVEWAIADSTIWLLQSRPITSHRADVALSAGRPAGRRAAIALSAGGPASQGVGAVLANGAGAVLVTGTPASPGTAAGPVRIMGDLNDFARFRPGDVLVCRATSPAWTPLLACAAAVVTETGGVLAHAAIVAREFGIPAVTDAVDTMIVLSDEQHVVVDGTTGTVSALSENRP